MARTGLAGRRPLVRAKRHDSCSIPHVERQGDLELSKAISSCSFKRVPGESRPGFVPSVMGTL